MAFNQADEDGNAQEHTEKRYPRAHDASDDGLQALFEPMHAERCRADCGG